MSKSFHKILPSLEKVFLTAAILTFLLMSVDIRVPYLLNISIVGLAFTFFMNAFQEKEIKRTEDKRLDFNDLFIDMIAPKILWISTAIVTMGILFYMLDFGNNGYANMLIIGSVTIVICSVLSLVLVTKRAGNFGEVITPIFYRALPALVYACFILYKTNNI